MEIIIKLNLSNYQKIRVYKHAKENIQNDINNSVRNIFVGLCWYINHASIDCGYSVSGDDVGYGLGMKANFPEVYKHKPKKKEWHDNTYWFPNNVEGSLKRIAILDKAIKKLEKLEAKL